jgi:hypothetical protein
MVLLYPALSRGDILHTWEAGFSGGFASTNDQWSSRVGYVSSDWATNICELTFLFDASDIGNTFVINSTSGDGDFNMFSSLATDGSHNGDIYWGYVTPILAEGDRGSPESSFLGTSSNSFNSVDFAGYNINSITFTLTEDTVFNIPGDDPNGDGNWTSFTISGEFAITGSVIPEPSSANLIVMAIVGMVSLRRYWMRSKV